MSNFNQTPAEFHLAKAKSERDFWKRREALHLPHHDEGGFAIRAIMEAYRQLALASVKALPHEVGKIKCAIKDLDYEVYGPTELDD